ncbi:MAG: ArnT family glycosyltransferase [Myxococcota bacterium]
MTAASDAAVREETAPTLWACAAVLAVAATVFILLRVPLLPVPLERDEGEYAYIAQRMQAGDVPYRDVFDQKPPGVFVAYLVAFAAFGETSEGIHLFLHVWSAATAALLFALVRRLAGSLSGAFAALIFAVASADPRLTANAANTEIFMLLPMVASVFCLLRAIEAGSSSRWWLLCGATAAAACLFKQVAVANAAFVAAIAFASLRRVPGERLRAIAALAAGGVAVIAPVLGLFAWLGAWSPFVDAVLLHNFRYALVRSPAAGWSELVNAAGVLWPSMGAFAGAAALGLMAPGRAGRSRWFLGLWLLASAAGVAPGLYFRPHYFIQMLPSLAALGGVALGGLACRWLDERHVGAAVLGLGALVAIAVGPPVAANAWILSADTPERIARILYGGNPFPESLRIAEHIRSRSDPDDRVFVVGSEPQILFYAGRPSASRYIFFYPLTGPFPDAPERQRTVAAEVDAARPLYVVWVNVATSLSAAPAAPGALARAPDSIFTHTRRMLERAYRVELVAHPAADGDGYVFAGGAEATGLMPLAWKQADRAAWIAVFRRRDRTRPPSDALVR